MPDTTPKPAAKKATRKRSASKSNRSLHINFKSASEMREFLASNKAGKDLSYRMVGKETAKAPTAPNEDPEQDKSNTTEGTWGSKPAVAKQLELHPTTVRAKASVTRQLVLSQEKDLEAWNELQARMHPAGAPQVRLSSYECELAQSLGSYIILVTYAELEYQQI